MGSLGGLETNFQKLTVADNLQINILLLGETGVGKSTFINSTVNYLHFSELQEALEEEETTVLIPTKLNITDKNGKPHNIEIGESSNKNEYISNGQSATQDVKSYVFPLPEELGKNGKMRFLDTPGMGDTRGIEQDDINCENILSFVAKYEQIHGICILLKSNNTRLTAAFLYCIKKILSHLDKSAANNIIFAFTNSRGSNYTPGDTEICLKEIIDKVQRNPPHVKIPFDNNLFCFDNEGFRCLVAMKKNVDISDMAKENAIASWNQSAKECVNLIRYVTDLRPHEVNNLLSINEARKSIWQLSKPLADVSGLIENKITVMRRHQDVLKDENNSIEDLRDNLYIPVVNLRLKELSQPVTVCTSSNCVELLQVENVKSPHYKTRCHNPCYLQNVTKEIVGDTELKNCWAMENDQCRVCECSYKVHIHIYYETETYLDKIIDENIKNNIKKKEDLIKEKEKLIKEIKTTIRELKQEQDYIAKANAYFAYFLQNNAIAPFNDAYKEYINHLINNEKALGENTDKNKIYRLQKMSEQHDQMKYSFDEALKSGDPDFDLTPHRIQDNIKGLVSLKHTGNNIKELFESQKKSLKKERQNTEYVHTNPIKKFYYKTKNFVSSVFGGGSNENENNADIQQMSYNHSHFKNNPQTQPCSQFVPYIHQNSYNGPPNYPIMPGASNIHPMYYSGYSHPYPFPELPLQDRYQNTPYYNLDSSEGKRCQLQEEMVGENISRNYDNYKPKLHRRDSKRDNERNFQQHKYTRKANDDDYRAHRFDKRQERNENRMATKSHREQNSDFEYEDNDCRFVYDRESQNFRGREPRKESNFEDRYSSEQSSSDSEVDSQSTSDHQSVRSSKTYRNYDSNLVNKPRKKSHDHSYERREENSRRKRKEHTERTENYNKLDPIDDVRDKKQRNKKETNRNRSDLVTDGVDYYSKNIDNFERSGTIGRKTGGARQNVDGNIRQLNKKYKHKSHKGDPVLKYASE